MNSKLNSDRTNYDVVVAGSGIGGICAALAAARLNCRVLLIEKMDEIGGTGVHSVIGLICSFRDHLGKPINNGIHREIFPQAYNNTGLYFEEEKVPTYDEQDLKITYQRLLAAEPNITVWTGCEVVDVNVHSGRIDSISVTGRKTIQVHGNVFLDATADGNLAAMAGAEFQKGRESDGKMQSATLTFKLSGFDSFKLIIKDITTWGSHFSLVEELSMYYEKMKLAGKTSNGRVKVLCFPYPDGKALLFNSTAIVDVDPTLPETIEYGMQEGQKQINELVQAIKEHPAFHEAKIDFISTKLGVREGRRIIGDYILTAEDCLSARKFEDMVAACSYELDIHDPDGKSSALEVNIPNPGYYHIPYRCLIPKGLSNMLLSSRCISGSFEAHSSYRVMSGISAIGEAAGTAAALMTKSKADNVRIVPAAQIRYVLQTRGQFVEGPVQFTKVMYDM